MLPWVLLTLLAVASLLVAEWRELRAGVWVAKPLAATGFIAAALAAGAGSSPYGRIVLVALGLCWLGDLLLIPRGARATFLAGMASFGLGHLVFGAAFFAHGVAPVALVATMVAAALAGAGAWRWLRPHLKPALRLPVLGYVTVICAMIALALATVDIRIALGAAMFCISDLAVARERFVKSEFTNKLWGLPLYFGAQLVLASTVAV